MGLKRQILSTRASKSRIQLFSGPEIRWVKEGQDQDVTVVELVGVFWTVQSVLGFARKADALSKATRFDGSNTSSTGHSADRATSVA